MDQIIDSSTEKKTSKSNNAFNKYKQWFNKNSKSQNSFSFTQINSFTLDSLKSQLDKIK